MRSGLELDLGAFKKVGWMAARLTVMPGMSEAVVVGRGLLTLAHFSAQPKPFWSVSRCMSSL